MNYKQEHFKTSRKKTWMAHCYLKQLEKEPTTERTPRRIGKKDFRNLALDKAAPV